MLSGLFLAAVTIALSGCVHYIYHNPANPYAGRGIPPSGLLQRVLVSYTSDGSNGGLEILDGLRNIRGNIQNTITSFHISGYSAPEPLHIINYPEQQRGYILSYTDGALGTVNYRTEASAGTAAQFGAYPPSVAAATDGTRFVGAINGSGLVRVIDTTGTYDLNLPNVDKVVLNPGNTVILAMVKNSNMLYRVVKLPSATTIVTPPGAVDCEPLRVPVYCVVPVGNTSSAHVAGAAYDEPIDAVFSNDGTKVYILNCGPECGGTTASVTVLDTATLAFNDVPTVDPLSSAATSPLSTLPVPNPVPIPGGVTTALSDGTNLYLAGQQLQTSGQYSGLFAGNLSVLNLTSYTLTSKTAISDGTHTRMLFADDNTLWIGGQQCASGVRAATATYELAHSGTTDQAGDYNCLTAVVLPSSSTGAPAATIVPAVVQTTSGNGAVTVGYPNTNDNQYYYGDLTGLCWVQSYHKVFTAYGGQVHAFYTGGTITDKADPAVGKTPALGTEINNFYLTVQGTALDVAYMDALTNAAD